MKKPRTGRRPTAGKVPEKIAPKSFKPIPDDAPAKELGEYLRTMIRDAEVSLDRVVAASGLAKNTLTTTMDGRSKGWRSVEQWMTAYSKAVGVPVIARQFDEIQRLFKLGRQNHLAAQRGRGAKAARASSAAGRSEPAAAPAWALDGEELPPLTSLLVEVSIKLPRRTPGAGIDAANERFREKDEIKERIAEIEQKALQGRLRHGPVRLGPVSSPWFSPTADFYGPWTTVYQSVVAPYQLRRAARPVPVPRRIRRDLPPDLDLLIGPCEPTTGAPAGAGQPPIADSCPLEPEELGVAEPPVNADVMSA